LVVRYAVIGDIHSNLEAFQAVLADLEGAGVEQVLCVGDVVGYGADPEACLRLVEERCLAVVGGNHDVAAGGQGPLDLFNPYARRALEWTTEQLSTGSQETLAQLPLTTQMNGFALVHSSFFAPERFDYIFAPSQARVCFLKQESPLAFFGHTHIPIAFFYTDPITFSQEPELTIDPEIKTLVNVGSVGQPRDEDARACYVLYDSDRQTVSIRRVTYDIEGAAKRITDAGLPEILAERLFLGR
jgi:diadenosine tetraphosphatase ApaH/serine/threonine PP2A family protein phosphatase